MLAVLAAGVFYSVRMVTRTRLPIRVAQVQRGNIVNVLSTNGVIEPVSNFEAHAPNAALVKGVYLHEGDKVPAGKLLIALDDSEERGRVATALNSLRAAQASYEAITKGGSQQERYSLQGDLARTRADRDQAENQLATLKKLVAQGAASTNEVTAAQQRLDQATASLHLLEQRRQSPYAPVDVEHARAALADAQTAYDSALHSLAQSTVRAPFAGTVYSLSVSSTAYVAQGDRLLQMADLNKLQVRAYFDEPEIGQLSVGLPIEIQPDAMPSRLWQGRIIRLPSTVIGYTTRHVGATIVAVDNADDALLPDATVTVTVTTSSTKDVLTMPREALHSNGAQDFVYLLDGEKLRRTPVKVGANNLTTIQIVSGLQQGQSVAVGTTNGQPIVDGVPVKVAP